MTKQRKRFKGHCALCGHDLGNSTRKWWGNPLRRATLGRTRRVNRQTVIAAAKAEE